ncbi:MAG: hypothetical protein ACYTBP_04215 [Planctomycetota bacterium]|jgi:hypothetical protein
MKAKLVFAEYCDEIQVDFKRETELEFLPYEGMQFIFESSPFELFVNMMIWYYDEGILLISFNDIVHETKEELIESIRPTLARNQWQYSANKKGGEIIKMLLKESDPQNNTLQKENNLEES